MKEAVRQVLQDTLHREVIRKIILLQSWLRMVLERRHFLRMRMAAITLQVQAHLPWHPQICFFLTDRWEYLFICFSLPVGILAFLPCPAGTREGKCCHLHTVSLAWVQRVEILPAAAGKNLSTSGSGQEASPTQEVSSARCSSCICFEAGCKHYILCTILAACPLA